jgi:hypothetical protein
MLLRHHGSAKRITKRLRTEDELFDLGTPLTLVREIPQGFLIKRKLTEFLYLFHG